MPYTKAFKEANPELVKKRQKAASDRYRENHPERVRKQKQKWYEDNREHSIDKNRKWRERNPEGEFNAHLKRKYGITREQYDAVLVAQNNVCGICGGYPVGRVRTGSVAKRFDVDHCHITGKVRGLLCHPCNVMLGQARDRVEILQAAILWLSK